MWRDWKNFFCNTRDSRSTEQKSPKTSKRGTSQRSDKESASHSGTDIELKVQSPEAVSPPPSSSTELVRTRPPFIAEHRDTNRLGVHLQPPNLNLHLSFQ